MSTLAMKSRCHARPRQGFTLIELLITISIIGLMAGMLLFALSAAQETAKEQKTRATIAKIDSIIKAKWESYRTRRVPITITASSPTGAAIQRLNALRQLMRLEMPDRFSDIDPANSSLPMELSAMNMTRPALSLRYARLFASASASSSNIDSECLFAICTAPSDEGDGREAFKEAEIGDTDRNGLPEFIDGWGRPIGFIRWPAGFVSTMNNFVSDLQVADSANAHDPFDPKRVDTAAYSLYPLVYSAGPDGSFDINMARDFTYTRSRTAIDGSTQLFDPYANDGNGRQIGVPFDGDGNGRDNSRDNIHNHRIGTR